MAGSMAGDFDRIEAEFATWAIVRRRAIAGNDLLLDRPFRGKPGDVLRIHFWQRETFTLGQSLEPIGA